MAHLINRTSLTLLVFFATLVVTLPANAGGQQKIVSTGPDNVAIKGYDPVAYFTEGKATKGKSEFAFSWYDAEWRFANARHRDLFAANPEDYAPKFGGFCSMAMTIGWVIAVDPENWEIVDGKLYLVHTKRGIQKFRENPRHYIKQSEAEWAKKQQEN